MQSNQVVASTRSSDTRLVRHMVAPDHKRRTSDRPARLALQDQILKLARLKLTNIHHDQHTTYILDIETRRDAEHREIMRKPMKYKGPASGIFGMVPEVVAEYLADHRAWLIRL